MMVFGRLMAAIEGRVTLLPLKRHHKNVVYRESQCLIYLPICRQTDDLTGSPPLPPHSFLVWKQQPCRGVVAYPEREPMLQQTSIFEQNQYKLLTLATVVAIKSYLLKMRQEINEVRQEYKQSE